MKKLKLFTIIGILFVIITGSLAHFLYDWTGNHFMVGLITPVNESVWEHMKLLFFPMLIYSTVMIPACRRKYPSIVSSYCLGILAGTFFIPIFYYTYTAILGKDVFVLDIAAFLVSIVISFLLSYRFTLSGRLKPYTLFLLGLVCILLICFIVFTYRPPAAGIFADPAAEAEQSSSNSTLATV